MKHARALDGRRKSGESLPPLFGLPVSIKESIGVSYFQPILRIFMNIIFVI